MRSSRLWDTSDWFPELAGLHSVFVDLSGKDSPRGLGSGHQPGSRLALRIPTPALGKDRSTGNTKAGSVKGEMIRVIAMLPNGTSDIKHPLLPFSPNGSDD